MMYNLKVYDEEKDLLLPAVLEVIDESNEVILILRVDERIYKAKDTFPFVALCTIREALEKEAKKICCKGSRPDVHPSGAMLIGFGAYKLTMGKRPTERDIVNIFDPEDDISLLGSVKDQENRYKKWLESL